MIQYTELAKKAVEKYVKEGKKIEPTKMTGKKAGVFVTIEKDGEFRACIGTFLPVEEDISKEIVRNAVAAATEDYRLGPVIKDELPSLSYSVYILEEPELISSIEDLNPREYGIIVRSNSTKTGLLLPGLEGIETANKQILLACQKASINPETEDFLIYRFRAEKHED